MNPPCGRCNKAVYPTEKINCLDKYWHKGCFSCEVCKMALSMKNYKGFDKKPYCSMHYPKTSFTTVTDTPENLRLKQQSMLNSQALYKEKFEKNKGKGFSVVADTPEMTRVKKTQDLISNIKYHEEFEKSKIRSDAPPPENRQDNEQQQTPNPQTFIHNVGPTPTAAEAPPSGGIKYQVEFERSKNRSAAPHPEKRQDYEQQQPPNPQTFSHLVGPMRRAAVAPPSGGKRYTALYSYTAADADELSLQEGDLISDTEQIDEGWMYGSNQRTGQRGMLPANYVQLV